MSATRIRKTGNGDKKGVFGKILGKRYNVIII
jgi:hypothetical protein